MHHHMLLVCHAADGHFADGDRDGIRRVLDESDCIVSIDMSGPERYAIVCRDGGQPELYAPGLHTDRAFHRMELALSPQGWTSDTLKLVFELMRAGGFGLMDSLDAAQIIVSSPQQVAYFPRLLKQPLLVRNSRDLGLSLL
ncbi:MAG: hypothetical protein GYB65_19250 [Chloroflexi bacterium]|nr:hypothetical protein [Chloroflexota bacterium]